jgi:hypothetical protein
MLSSEGGSIEPDGCGREEEDEELLAAYIHHKQYGSHLQTVESYCPIRLT